MTLEMDLGGVEAWEAGSILPPGRHLVKVVEASEGKSASGHPQLELKLEATDGEYAGGTIRDWITFSAKAAGRVKQVLLALGWAELDGKVSVNPDDVVGRKAWIVVRTEPYDGKDRSKVMAYEAADGAESTPSASNGAKADDEDLPF